MVDVADVLLLQALDLAEQLFGALQARLQFVPGGIAGGDGLAGLPHFLQIAVEVAPVAALQHGHTGRALRVFQPFGHHPGEVRAGHVAVADLQQLAGHELAALHVHRQATGQQAGARHLFGFHQLAGQLLRRLAGDAVLGFDHIGRPEVGEAAHGDHRQQAEGHDHGDGDGTAVHPHPGGAALEPVLQVLLFHHELPLLAAAYSEAYFLRRRVRISSAPVFITKVNISSTSADRNSTR